MKEDSDQKERCNKKAEGKFGFFEDCQSDTTSKKAKKRSLYKQNIFCSSELVFLPVLWKNVQVYVKIMTNRIRRQVAERSCINK